MKKTIKYLLIIPFLCLNLSSFSMEPGADANNGNYIIPPAYKVSINIPTYVWFSTVGTFIACLGGLLMYKGAQKTSLPACDNRELNPQPEPTVEGAKLMGQGALLAFAGLFTIWLNKN